MTESLFSRRQIVSPASLLWCALAALSLMLAAPAAAQETRPATGPASEKAATKLSVDPAHSSVTFKIKHKGVAWVYGRFNDLQGQIHWDEDYPERIHFDVHVKTENVDTGVERRDDHLRSADFFDASENPTIRFVSKKVKSVGDNKYEMTGELSLHGETHSITVPFEKTGEAKSEEEHRLGGHAEFTVDRTDFGMDKMVGPVGAKAHMAISIEATAESS